MERRGLRERLRRVAQRIVSPGVSERETRALPFSESSKYLTQLAPPVEKKGSGVGFVTSPYMQYLQKVWGLMPYEDFGELREMYRKVPYIHGAINVTANLVLSGGFDLVGGRQEIRDYLLEKIDELNLDQVLKPAVIDMLVTGNAFIEKCYEKDVRDSYYEEYVRSRYVKGLADADFVTEEEKRLFKEFEEKDYGEIVQLKVLDPLYIRLRADAYGNIFGAIQLIVIPPVVFRSWQILHLKYLQRSEFQYGLYGLSPLHALIGIQRKINVFEDSMSQIVLTYGKPVLIVKVGTPEKPATLAEVEEVKSAFEGRQPASDIIIKGDYDVKPIQALSPASSQVSWYLEYLLEQRDAVLGVPKIFLGRSEATNRATSDTVLTEYISRISVIQANIAQQLEDNLFKPLVAYKFGEDAIKDMPRIRWREIIPPTKSQNILNAINLYKAGIATLKEVREQLGLPTDEEILKELEEAKPSNGKGITRKIAPELERVVP